MIQIDDAGSGSLVGGTAIGILRVETLEYYYEIIPVELFKAPYFKEKKYKGYVNGIILRGFKSLEVGFEEKIKICRGYIFDYARPFLKDKGYCVISAKITDPLQSIIERSFLNYVVSLGIPPDYLKYTKFPFHFHHLYKWVLADFEKRRDICKTGWKSFEKYKNPLLYQYTDTIYSKYSCLKCSKPIIPPCKVLVLKAQTNVVMNIYLHFKCPSQ